MQIPWYAYAIAATVFATAFSITRKKALTKDHAMSFEVVRTMTVALLCLFFIPFINLSVNWKILLLIYGASLLGTIGIFFAARALKHEAISLIAPLGNIEPGFIAILAFLFLGESLGIKKIIGLGILLIAAYLLESDHHFSDFYAPIKHLLRDKYSLFFLFAIGLFSIVNIINKYVIDNHLDIFTYFFLTWVFIAFNFNLAHSFKYGFKDTINCFKKISYMPVIVAVFSLVRNLLFLKALSMTMVSLVAPIGLLGTLFIVFIGGEYFHEKYLLFRLGASVIMLIGAYLIII